MQTSVTFKNLDPSETLNSYVSSKLDRLDKFLDNPAEANVMLTVEKFRHIAEINLIGARLNINSKEETGDMYSAIDLSLDKLEVQIKKHKEKIRKRRGSSKAKANLFSTEIEASIPEGEKERQIHLSYIDYKPMDVEEAAMQMDLINNNFMVFTNSRTDTVNVLYRRNDGDYGLIQPNI